MRALVAIAAVAAALCVFVPVAGAATTQCSGVVTGEVDGNLVVPSGSACTLAGAQVHGNVLVSPDASLHSVDAGVVHTRIDGSVLGYSVRSVLLQYQTQVGGNFAVLGASQGVTGFDINVRIGGYATIVGNKGYTFVDSAIVDQSLFVEGSTGGVEVEWNRVGGSEDVSWNTPDMLSVYGNQVAGNLTVMHNTGAGHKQVIANTAGRLMCFANDEVFVGGPNTTANTTGQCF
jgi:hypothetical protein